MVSLSSRGVRRWRDGRERRRTVEPRGVSLRTGGGKSAVSQSVVFRLSGERGGERVERREGRSGGPCLSSRAQVEVTSSSVSLYFER